MNQSLDGYVDHMALTRPRAFPPLIEQVRATDGQCLRSPYVRDHALLG